MEIEALKKIKERNNTIQDLQGVSNRHQTRCNAQDEKGHLNTIAKLTNIHATDKENYTMDKEGILANK